MVLLTHTGNSLQCTLTLGFSGFYIHARVNKWLTYVIVKCWSKDIIIYLQLIISYLCLETDFDIRIYYFNLILYLGRCDKEYNNVWLNLSVTRGNKHAWRASFSHQSEHVEVKQLIRNENFHLAQGFDMALNFKRSVSPAHAVCRCHAINFTGGLKLVVHHLQTLGVEPNWVYLQTDLY